MAATLSELAQQNPNISSQIDVWQRERINNGQSPADWEAFRQHASGIGAPDPGQEAPGEFMQSAQRAQASAASAQASAASAQSSASSASDTSGGSFASPQAQAPAQQQTQWPQPSQQVQQPSQPSREALDAIKVRNDYEADKNTPTDKWLKARGMTKAQLDAALALAASADPNKSL